MDNFSTRFLQNKGFTLLEVMASLLIFSLVVAGMGPAFIAHEKYNTESQIRTDAIAAAERALDLLRYQNPTSLPTSGTSAATDYIINGKTYSVFTVYCLTSTYCQSPNNRHITIRVKYKNKQVFETETVFTQLK
ncbi:MAG: type II secretion system protein [Proteobacteria bacterium]|nr:type II secretion system protein [Pseudomonadota bacterium]